MIDVRARPIRDYCLGIFDGPHATPGEADDGPIFLGIKNITDDGRLDLAEIRHVSEQEFPKWTKRVTPQSGDVVFTYEATLHRYAIIPDGFRGCLGRRVALVRPDPAKVDSRFLLYYFLSFGWRRVVEGAVINGATVDRIPLEKFPDFPIRLPALNVQKSIADVLSAYDDLIANNSRRIELLEQSTRLLFKEWFVRLRYPGHEHDKVVGGVPQGWERKPLGKVLTLHYGKALQAEKREPGEVIVYGSSGEVGKHNVKLVEGPGIVVGRKGNVGSVFWVDASFWPIDTVYYVEPEKVSLFDYHLLQTLNFQNSDAAVPGLNREYAYSTKVLKPSRSLIDEFEEFAKSAFAQRRCLLNQNAKLGRARDLLLPRLMDGRIAV